MSISTKPRTLKRGICYALSRSAHRGDFKDFLLEQGLQENFPVSQICGIANNGDLLSHYNATAGEWFPDTEAGCARLTLWGAFLHYLEERGK